MIEGTRIGVHDVVGLLQNSGRLAEPAGLPSVSFKSAGITAADPHKTRDLR
jgi:hypothetical protein